MNPIYYQSFQELGLSSDFRLVNFPENYLAKNEPMIKSALTGMRSSNLDRLQIQMKKNGWTLLVT